MRLIWNYLTSMSAMAFMFLVFAFAMGVATFIETGYGTPAARVLVYNAWWFELLMLLLAINLVDNLLKYKQYKRKNLTMFTFHISFLVILIGAAVTRYISFEGTMHIREGNTASHILSYNNYLYAQFGDDAEVDKVEFSELTPKRYKSKLSSGGETLTIASVGYITDAVRTPIPSDTGSPAVDFVLSGPGGSGMSSYVVAQGNLLRFNAFSIGFESTDQADFHLFMNSGQLSMVAREEVTQMAMGAEEGLVIPPGDTIALFPMNIYNFGSTRFLVRNFYEKAIFSAAKSAQGRTGENAIVLKVSDGRNERIIPIFGIPGYEMDTVTYDWHGKTLKLAYGSKKLPIPFSMHLREFQLDRYPGSDSPASYASEVTLIDEEEGVRNDMRIYMNSTLTYRGYKFFQSSYDQDEQGTILSVNHDFWGTWITYIGYFLLTIGMILSLINPNSHFQNLARRLKKISTGSLMMLLLTLGLSLPASAQPGSAAHIPVIDSDIVTTFSNLWVHSPDGRIEPVSTLSSDIVRKLSRKQKVYGRSTDEVLLSMMLYPESWQRLPMLKISNKALATTLNANGSYISLVDLFDSNGNYRLAEQVQAAYSKNPSMRNRVEKEYIYLDEKVNISFLIFRSNLITIFPTPDSTEPWMYPGVRANGIESGDSMFVASGIDVFKQFVMEGNKTGAIEVLRAVSMFQSKYASDILPTENQKKAERFYNNLNPFQRVFPYYLAFGFILLFILFVNIFRMKPINPWLKRSFYGLILLLFVVHTGGLIVRWYISGHAPWSNGYESVIYVAWASMLAGFLFGSKYPMVVGTASVFAGISLFVAHLSWMNPEITPLVPVLNSYWLTIHVSVITASYGFIGLSAFLGILVMILILIRNRVNMDKVNVIMEQLTIISEMSATVGLYFLTIGTFLGGIWANESWGRYWGWDPKETWSLVTIVVYSFIVHMRLIPSLRGLYNYNMAAILGLLSVLMTYFGVNYYLSGLHSYGRGSVDGLHPALPATLVVICVLMFLAFIKDNLYEKEMAALQQKKKKLKKSDSNDEGSET